MQASTSSLAGPGPDGPAPPAPQSDPCCWPLLVGGCSPVGSPALSAEWPRGPPASLRRRCPSRRERGAGPGQVLQLLSGAGDVTVCVRPRGTRSPPQKTRQRMLRTELCTANGWGSGPASRGSVCHGEWEKAILEKRGSPSSQEMSFLGGVDPVAPRTSWPWSPERGGWALVPLSFGHEAGLPLARRVHFSKRTGAESVSPAGPSRC